MKIYNLLLIFLYSFFSISYSQYQYVPFIIHIHSTYSDNGKYDIEKIVELARDKGIKVIIITDHYLTKCEYGIFPLRNLLKKTVEKKSVFKLGVKKYLNEINSINQKYDDIIVIPGIECTPFYFWSGNIFSNNLMLTNWHKHLLIVGLYESNHYYNLPVIGNEKNAGKFNITLFLIPLILLITGIFLIKNLILKIFCLVLTTISFINNFPFKTLPYTQYSGDPGKLPYQTVIDYVNKVAPETGLVFWAHPEASNYVNPVKFGPVYMKTEKYHNSLYTTRNYTGFAYFQEGYKIVGSPGGIWDKILTEYCKGQQDNPVFAIAELDYREEGFLGTYIDSYKNVILMCSKDELNLSNVVKYIKQGKFYLVSKLSSGYELILEKFDINVINNSAVIEIIISSSDKKIYPYKLTLISEGKIVKVVNPTTGEKVSFTVSLKNVQTYFRIECVSQKSKLVSNPIFVTVN